MKPVRPSLTALLGIGLIAALPLVQAEEAGALTEGISAIKNTGKSIGHATRDVTKKIGHATRDATKAIGHTTRDATREVGHATRDTTKEIGHPTRDAARHVKKSVTTDQ